MNKIKILMTFLCAALLVLGMVSSASALPVATSDAIAFGNETAQPLIDAAIAPYLGGATELYKQNAGEAFDTGSYAASYATAYGAGNETAVISYVGAAAPFISPPPAFLLVKDGNQEPAWYLFDLYDLGWNGTDAISIGQIWPNQGSISHVALYGDSTGITVSEPLTLLLLGFGLVGLAGVRRFRK